MSNLIDFSTHAKTLVGAAALSTTLLTSAYAAPGPFDNFSGSWHGEGRVYDVNGHTEPLRCRSKNVPSQDNINLDLTIVCASASYRFDFNAELYTDGHSLRGTWTETSRNANGNVSGSLSSNAINADISAPGLTAKLTVRSAAHKLDVSLLPQGTSINRVEVTMKP